MLKKRIEAPHTPSAGLFADEFRRGRSYSNWRPRGTPDWLLIYTAEGAGYLTTAAKEGATQAGEVTLYAPGDYQDYRTDPEAGRWNLLWVHFLAKPSWQPWLRWPVGARGVKSLYLEKGEVREGFVAAMRRMIRAFRGQVPHAQDFATNALEEALLWAQVGTSQGEWARTDLRVRRAMKYLTENLRQPFWLEKVARHCGLSVSRLAHLFKGGTGISPQQFFEQQRMWHAGQLLRLTGLGIAEVAAEVGYEDPFYFSNRFRRYAGKSPTEFREQKKSGKGRLLKGPRRGR